MSIQASAKNADVDTFFAGFDTLAAESSVEAIAAALLTVNARLAMGNKRSVTHLARLTEEELAAHYADKQKGMKSLWSLGAKTAGIASVVIGAFFNKAGEAVGSVANGLFGVASEYFAAKNQADLVPTEGHIARISSIMQVHREGEQKGGNEMSQAKDALQQLIQSINQAKSGLLR